MEYVQERVTTLHALTDHRPSAPTGRTAVVVPMTEREYGTLAAENVLTALETVDPARVIVPLRATPDRAGPFADWLDGFDLDVETLWCDGPQLSALLADRGVNGSRGKGRDVWLALGQALDEEFVVVHDADTKTYSPAFVNRLLFPIAHGHEFSKGYYARVEDGALYGRLFRLFFRPLVRALDDAHDAAQYWSIWGRSGTRSRASSRQRPTSSRSSGSNAAGDSKSVHSARRSPTPVSRGAHRSTSAGTNTTTAPSTARPGSRT